MGFLMQTQVSEVRGLHNACLLLPTVAWSSLEFCFLPRNVKSEKELSHNQKSSLGFALVEQISAPHLFLKINRQFRSLSISDHAKKRLRHSLSHGRTFLFFFVCDVIF